MTHLTRRQALVYLGGIAVAGLIPGTAIQATPSRSVVTAAMELFGKLETRVSAALIGQAYLRRYPSENNAETLLHALDFMVGRNPADADVTVLARWYAERISQDFESVNVVNVDGWVLSRTEARVFGLLSLQ